MPTLYCRHIRANGTRCNSPALRGEPLCYFHQRERNRYPNRRQRPLAGEVPACEIPDAAYIETILHPLNPDRDGLQRDPQAAIQLQNPAVREYFGLPAQPSGPVTLDFPPLEDRESIQIAISMVTSALGQGLVDTKRAGVMLYALQVASANAKTLTHDPHTVTEIVPSPDGHDLAPNEDPEQDPGNDPDEDFDEDSDEDHDEDFDADPRPLGSAAALLKELESLHYLPSDEDFEDTRG